MKRFVKISIAVACLFIAACSSNIKRADVGDVGVPITISKYKDVSIKLTDEAKKKLAENLKFNPDTLRSTVQRALDARSLIQPGADETIPSVEIMITDMR